MNKRAYRTTAQDATASLKADIPAKVDCNIKSRRTRVAGGTSIENLKRGTSTIRPSTSAGPKSERVGLIWPPPRVLIYKMATEA